MGKAEGTTSEEDGYLRPWKIRSCEFALAMSDYGRVVPTPSNSFQHRFQKRFASMGPIKSSDNIASGNHREVGQG